MNSLLNKYAPFKKISKYKLKIKAKPWITFGIQKWFSIKNIKTTIPHSVEFSNRTIAEPTTMNNVFINYSTSIAEKTKSNIKFSPKHYTDYLSSTNTNTFLTPTDKNEIAFIISSLDSHKSSGPNSIPVKILKLLKNDISQQLSDIFNMSFLTGQFPSVLKIAKVIPIHKKQSKVDYANYRPISLLSNIEKIIEKLMYKRLSNFLDINNLIYSLQFGFQQ